MNFKFALPAVAAAVLSCASAFAAPQTYVSVAVGGSDANIDCTGTDSCKDTATAAKVIGGYDFGNSVAIEAMYVSLGAPRASVGGISTDIRSSYWGLGAAWRPALNHDWSAVTRLGVAFSTSTVEASDGTNAASQAFHSTQAYAGLGIAYALTSQLKLEADLDSTQIQVGSGSTQQNARVIDYTLGLTYGF